MHTHGGTTVVETDRDSSAGIVVGVLVAILVLFLIWLFAFSGWVGTDSDVEQGPGVTNVEDEGDTNVNVPGGNTYDTEKDNGGTMAPSP